MHQARLVLQALQVLQVQLEQQVQLGLLVQQVPQVRRALLELQAPQVRVRRGQQGPQARLELRGPQGLLEPRAQREQRVLRVLTCQE